MKEVKETYVKEAEGDWRTLLFWQKVADLKIYIFSATKQDRVGPSLQSRNTVFISADFCSHCTVELDL